MNKHIHEVGCMMVSILLACFMLSCSSSDDEEVTLEKEKTVSLMDLKHIVRTVSKEYSINNMLEYEDEWRYTYDSQGRIITAVAVDSDGYGSYGKSSSYIYDGSSLTIKEGDRYGIKATTFVLSEGRVVDDGEYTYTYNQDGYVITQTKKDDTYNYLWTDGNLTGLEKNGHLRVWSYSKIPWPKNWFMYFKGSNWDAYLELAGTYGQMPKFLPEKFWYDEGYGWTFEYTIENGLITKVTYRDFDEMGEFKGSYAEDILEWE